MVELPCLWHVQDILDGEWAPEGKRNTKLERKIREGGAAKECIED